MEVGFLIIMLCLVAMVGTVLAIIHGEREHRNNKQNKATRQ